MTVVVRGEGLTADDVVAVARRAERVELAPEARERMERSRERALAAARRAEPVYGVSTGFGALAATRVAPERQAELQLNLIRSHAAGIGRPVAAEVVRAMMLLRARSLAMGLSGVRPALAEAIVDLLNGGRVPIVPMHGSLGASGDLAPLAHVALELVDRGLELQSKEGLALINGTDGMLAMLVLACEDARCLFQTADVAASMSVEALLGTDRAYAPDLQRIRPHPGQALSAANLTRLLAGSGIVASHRHSDHMVQDSYSMRCAPQVIGAARDTLQFAQQVAERELRAVVDNPVVLEDGAVASNGNFHGEPLAFALDFLAIAAAEVGAIAERRIDRLLDPARSQGLPAFLALEPGVNSGLMVGQYTAAALVSENRRLAQPASIDSLPTSADQEDHVSMGWSAGMKLRSLLENLAGIIAIELVCAARGLDFRAPLVPAAGTGAVRDLLRTRVPGPGRDRMLAPELAAATELVSSGAVVARAREAVGELR